MAQDYYTILTNAGLAYEAQQKAQNRPITLVAMAIGDGNGAAYSPDPAATTLRREVHRQPINSLLQDANNPTWLVAEAWLADDVGGWTIREVGIYTDTGVLYAIAKYPESIKPLLASGSGKQFYVRTIFQTSNVASVVLQVDNSVVMATRAFVVDYVRDELAKLDSKQSVRVATTANIALTGLQTIDGVPLAAGDRVLVKDQAAGKDNGIYVAVGGVWARATDADTAAKLTPELSVGVEQGTVNGDSLWMLTTDAPITLGVTALVFEVAGGRPLATKAWAQAYTSSALAALGLGLGNDIRQAALNGSNPPKDYYGKGERWGFVDGGPNGLLIPNLAANSYGCLRVSSQYSDESGVISVTREFTTMGRVFLSSGVSGTQWTPWRELANVAHVSDALSSAKQYADSVGSTTAQSANAYADGVGTSAKQYADGAAGGVLQSAKTYTDAALPVGSIILWPSSSPPASNYLRMNGAAISRTTYAKLFAVIGTAYGAGDGVSTFNLPDARGEFPRFWSDGSPVDSGRGIGSKQLDALQTHNHGLPTGSGNGPSAASRWGLPDNMWIDNGAGGSNANPDTNAYANTWESNAGGPNEVGRFNSTETRPRNIALMGLIKFQ
ncbi:phage tail protein [Comamonas resistens]|uniref:phage tail-collar fiber domain-containing protein n=1 Tax=Comamonas resistens TaxID=3046670 RepID=UPI0039BCF8A6